MIVGPFKINQKLNAKNALKNLMGLRLIKGAVRELAVA
jgi:hypothetical protein